MIKRNVLANFIGSGWTALLNFALIPIYIHFMGIESFGLIGFFVTLQAAYALLDLGLSTVVNRELARLSAQPDSAQDMRDLTRSLEVIEWSIAGLIALVTIALSPVIASQWINAQNMPAATVQQAVFLMGLAIAVQFPFSLYAGGLLGMQRQVALNVLKVISATVRVGGSILILWAISRTEQAYFGWQVAAFLAQTVFSAVLLWRVLPAGRRASRFDSGQLRLVWSFAAGMTGIAILATLLTQMDKLIVSRLLPLEQFGYYSLAATAASITALFITPIFTAIFPHLSKLVAADDKDSVKRVYHRACQLMAVVLMPVTVILVLFSPEVLFLWTRNTQVVESSSLVLSLLVAAAGLNGLMNVPYALMLAHGWTRLTVVVNLVAVIVLVPLTIALTSRYGGPGAAMVGVILNGGYLLVTIQIMHRRLLKTEKWRWYCQDVGLPLIACLATALLVRLLLPLEAPPLVSVVAISIAFLMAAVATAFSTPLVREWLYGGSLLSRLRASRV